jgi:hypothetical protein
MIDDVMTATHGDGMEMRMRDEGCLMVVMNRILGDL